MAGTVTSKLQSRKSSVNWARSQPSLIRISSVQCLRLARRLAQDLRLKENYILVVFESNVTQPSLSKETEREVQRTISR